MEPVKRFSFPDRLPYRIDNVEFIERNFRNQTTDFSGGRPRSSLIYTAEGRMIYTFGKEQIVIPEGEAIFIPEGTRQLTHYPKEGVHCLSISFHVVDGSLPTGFDRPRRLGKCGIERDMEEIQKCIPHEPIRLYCIAYSLLERLVRENEKISPLYRKILPAVREIERNYANDCRVADLAALCCMSESALRRLFREYLDMSPVDYRNIIRLHQAKALIGSGEFRIAEASEQVGFTNLSFFYRLYKRYFGYPPGKEK